MNPSNRVDAGRRTRTGVASIFFSLLTIMGMAGPPRPTPTPTPTPAPQFVQSPVLAPFVQDLRGLGPGGIPVAASDGVRYQGDVVATHYTIDINQFDDKLHPDLPPTTLWGYNPRKALGVNGVPQQKHLGGVIVAQRGVPIQITFRNNLPNKHILPVDTTIPGAEPDQAQNRTSTHVHGGLVPWVTDGGPFAWWDPKGEHGPSFLNNQVLRPGENVPPNEAEYYYPNDQSARFVWYHDHAIGITRLNAYAGIASGFIIRDNFESNVLVKALGLPGFIENGGRELPIVIQDKIFEPKRNPAFPGSAKDKGDLWYPYFYDPNRWTLAPGGNPPPVSVIPEMFGDTMLVNGTVYPKASVDPRRYRLRILNACNARFLNLQLYEDDGTGWPDFTKPGPDWLVIGTEGGFLARPVVVPSRQMTFIAPESVDPANPGGSLITAPAERWDVVINFNGKGGKKYILYNDAPAPYPGGDDINDYPNANNASSTRIMMRFEVKQDSHAIPPDPPFFINPSVQLAANSLSGIDKPLAGPDPDTPAFKLSWSKITTDPLPIPNRPGIRVRQLTLNEAFDEFGRLIQREGTNVATSVPDPNMADFGLPYEAPATEKPRAGATEVWQLANLTGDTHPIHFHLINAQILSRRPFDVETYINVPEGDKGKLVYTGPARGPDATELGFKETIKMNPGEVTTIIMKFDLPKVPFKVPQSPRTGGFEYVWHCHILEHEEHDMMRPLIVMP